MFGKTNLKTSVIIAVFLVVMACGISAGGTIYVDATRNGNGSSWTNAYKYLQDALDDAASGDAVWVAEGSYYPDANSSNPGGTGEREATFQLISGVGIFGGFPSGGGAWGDRDPNIYETILSGDLAGNDVQVADPCDLWKEPSRSENSYHVVTGSGTDATAIFDGFTVTAGNADGSGDHNYGGGMFSWGGSPTVTKCIFTRNSTLWGAGMNNGSNSSPTLTNCTFSGNWTVYGGGGMNNTHSNPTLRNCAFRGNRSGSYGGGGMRNSSSNPTLTNCTFSGNSANHGGGMCNDNYSSPTVTNCTFIGNSAYYGGGMRNSSSSPTLTNCTFSGNSGGGMYNFWSFPTVTNCTFTGNSGLGGMYNYQSSPSVTNCRFSGNSTQYDGGGMCNVNSSPTVTNCSFIANSADYWGGGMAGNERSNPTVTNCTFAANSAREGNALGCHSYASMSPSNVQLTNCILWDGGSEIWNNDNSTITISYSDLQGGWPGTGNIDGDPLFVDPNGSDGIPGTADDNLRVSPGSPCIDAGDNTAVPADTADLDGDGDTIERAPLDLDGHPRFFDDPLTADTGVPDLPDYPDIVDMGAYEYWTVIFVDANASGSNNGSCWADAYNYLQDALAHANSIGGLAEIRVAQGIYKPDRGTGIARGDRTATFQVINGVGIYGGFPPGGGVWADRDPNVYESILSGDLNGDDALDFANNAENSYHVVTCSGTNETAVLDGFTTTGGNANGSLWSNQHKGGGMYNDNSSPTVTNCTFSGSSATHYGGGVYNGGSSPMLTNCTFSGNCAVYGGGMSSSNNSRPTLTNCTFSENSASLGGGMFNDESSSTLTDCTFSGNTTHSFGGGGMFNSRSNPRLVNCTFTSNHSSDSFGGGMYNMGSSPTLTNCTFSENSAERSGGMQNYSNSSPTLTNCTFTGNWAYMGGGMSNTNSSPTLTNCTFGGNNAHDFGGGMRNYQSSPMLTDCTFSGNSADEGGGMRNYRSSPTLTNCTFWGNWADSYGGGMFNDSNSSPALANCTFTGNTADGGYWSGGGGMLNWYYSSPTLSNCTFSGNSAYEVGGGIYNDSISSPVLNNCILWANSDSGGTHESAQINRTPVVNYSCIQGWTGSLGGTGNIGHDPLFKDADGNDNVVGTQDDNLRLLPGSPCIDAGDNTAVPPDTADLDGDGNVIERTPLDLDGHARFLDDPLTADTGKGMPPVVDMGPYEFAWAYIGDFDSDGDVDFEDFAILALAWLTQPGDAGWNRFCDISIPADNSINMLDLAVFAENWLAGL